MLEFLLEYLTSCLCHRSYRIPVFHQPRPQLGIAQRVHRHFVTAGSNCAPSPRTKNPTRSRRKKLASATRTRFPAERLLPPQFILIDDQSRHLPFRHRYSRFSPPFLGSRTWMGAPPVILSELGGETKDGLNGNARFQRRDFRTLDCATRFPLKQLDHQLAQTKKNGAIF